MSNDNVHHPAHYTAGAVECIDAIEAATTGLTGAEAYNTGQIIKYAWRWKRKNGLEDLQKARWYLDRLIAAQQTPATGELTGATVQGEIAAPSEAEGEYVEREYPLRQGSLIRTPQGKLRARRGDQP